VGGSNAATGRELQGTSSGLSGQGFMGMSAAHLRGMCSQLQMSHLGDGLTDGEGNCNTVSFG